MNRKSVPLFILVLLLPALACNAPNLLSGEESEAIELSVPTATTAPPQDTATPVPTATDTLVPTLLPVTPTQQVVTVCDPAEVLENLRSEMSGEFTLSWLSVDFLTLRVWFVEPEIDMEASGSEVSANVDLAEQRAVEVSHQLARADECVGVVFAEIAAFVVDSQYNGWFHGGIPTAALPESDTPDESELSAAAAEFDTFYARSQAPAPLQPAPQGSCTWPEASEKITEQFAPDRLTNMSVFVAADEDERAAFAQWIDDPSSATHQDTVRNVAAEFQCLHPVVDRLIVWMLNPAGRLLYWGELPQEGIAELDLEMLNVIAVDDGTGQLVTVTPSATVAFVPSGDVEGTLVLQECRGYEGTVTFGQAAPQSLHAFDSMTFTVPEGDYPLRIDWLNHSDENVNTTVTITEGSQVMRFGDLC